MSNSVFPSLASIPGRQFGNKKRPTFNIEKFRAVSGREVRIGLMAYPLWEFELSFDILRDTPNVASPAAPQNELKTLAGFWLQQQNTGDSWLFDDTTDNAVTDQIFGVGDGAATVFGLARTWGGFVEPVQNVNAITNVKKAGVAQTNPTDYTIDAEGNLTFAVAPALGASLTWTGTYYYRCRFQEDVAEFEQFMSNLWNLGRLGFVGSTSNKV